jgi:outer membrane protein TolC
MSRVRDLTRKQYETGYVSYQTLLFAEQGYEQAVLVLVQAQTNRLGDTAALYQALGGGWWNRSEVMAKQDIESPTAASHAVTSGESVNGQR